MKVLLVEDYEEKASNIVGFLKVEFPDLEIERCSAYNTAQETIFDNPDKYGLILLDMSMTTYDLGADASGGKPEPSAGYDILEGMFLRDITTPVIIVTMYNVFGRRDMSSFHKEFLENYPLNYHSYVFYSSQRNDWKSDLKKKILEVLK